MTRVISRKDLYKQNYENAIIIDDNNTKTCSLAGFAEVMYYYYKEEQKQTEKGIVDYGKG